MPNCTEERDLFGALGRRRIEVGFDGDEVSSDAGGLLLLRQVERKLGLLKAAARVLPDPRNPDLILHTTEQLLRHRVFGLCQGYEDLNDHDRLRLDPALQTALDKRGKSAATQAGASSPTLCRFEARANRTGATPGSVAIGCCRGASATASTTSSGCRRTRGCWRWRRVGASRPRRPSSPPPRRSACSASSPIRRTPGAGRGE